MSNNSFSLNDAFYNYYEKVDHIYRSNPAPRKPAKVVRDDFSNDESYHLAKSEEVKALKTFKEKKEYHERIIELKIAKEEEKFKKILFSQYSQYSKESLERLFNRAKKKNDDYCECDWFYKFEEYMDIIKEIKL